MSMVPLSEMPYIFDFGNDFEETEWMKTERANFRLFYILYRLTSTLKLLIKK